MWGKSRWVGGVGSSAGSRRWVFGWHVGRPWGTSRQAATAALLCPRLICAMSLLWPLQRFVTPTDMWSALGWMLMALVAIGWFVVLLLIYLKMG